MVLKSITLRNTSLTLWHLNETLPRYFDRVGLTLIRGLELFWYNTKLPTACVCGSLSNEISWYLKGKTECGLLYSWWVLAAHTIDAKYTLHADRLREERLAIERFWTKPEAWTCRVYTPSCGHALQFWSTHQTALPGCMGTKYPFNYCASMRDCKQETAVTILGK